MMAGNRAGAKGIEWADEYLKQRDALIQEYGGQTILWCGKVVSAKEAVCSFVKGLVYF